MSKVKDTIEEEVRTEGKSDSWREDEERDMPERFWPHSRKEGYETVTEMGKNYQPNPPF